MRDMCLKLSIHKPTRKLRVYGLKTRQEISLESLVDARSIPLSLFQYLFSPPMEMMDLSMQHRSSVDHKKQVPTWKAFGQFRQNNLKIGESKNGAYRAYPRIAFLVVCAITILKHISSWEGLCHILWKKCSKPPTRHLVTVSLDSDSQISCRTSAAFFESPLAGSLWITSNPPASSIMWMRAAAPGQQLSFSNKDSIISSVTRWLFPACSFSLSAFTGPHADWESIAGTSWSHGWWFCRCVTFLDFWHSDNRFGLIVGEQLFGTSGPYGCTIKTFQSRHTQKSEANPFGKVCPNPFGFCWIFFQGYWECIWAQ